MACADPRRPHGWITPAIVEAYSRLHELGWAHSVEAWTEEGDLAGALYGLRIGGLFAGESMVHFERDGSKVALLGLVDLLRQLRGHAPRRAVGDTALRSLGAVAVGSPGLPRAARRGARPAGGVTSTSGHPHGPGEVLQTLRGVAGATGEVTALGHPRRAADGSSRTQRLAQWISAHRRAGHRPSRSVPTPVVGA